MAENIPGVVPPEQGQGPSQPAQASAPMAAPTPPPTQSPDVTPPAQPSPASQNISVGSGGPPQPKAPAGSFFKNLSHAFIGSVLGGLAGKQEISGYSTDPNTGKQTPVMKDLHPRDQLARIAHSALIGLAAGSATPEGKSASASGLAGFGAGAQAVTKFGQDQDLLKRAQSKEQFEAEQQAMLQRSSIAHNNALTLSTYYANLKTGNDMNPLFKENENLLEAAKNSPELAGTVKEITGEQLKQLQATDSAYLTNHIARPLGLAPVTDPNDPTKFVMEADGVTPKTQMRFGVFNGNSADATMEITPDMEKSIHEYGALSPNITNAAGIKAGEKVSLDKLLPLLNAVGVEKKNVLQGWQNAKVDWVKGPNGEDIPIQTNAYDSMRHRPFTSSVTSGEAKVEEDKHALTMSELQKNDAAAAESLGRAQEAIATARMYNGGGAGGAGEGSGDLSDIWKQPEVQSALSSLPPNAQSILRSVKPIYIPDLISVATGTAKLTELFPARVSPKSGQMDAAHGWALAQVMNPNLKGQDYKTMEKLQEDFTSDKGSGGAIASFNQFLVHANDAIQASKELQRSNSPWVNTPINAYKSEALGDPAVKRLQTALMAAGSEWDTFIHSGHVPTTEETTAERQLTSPTSNASQVYGVLNMMGSQAVGRLDQINERWKSGWGMDYPALVSPSGKEAANSLGLGDVISKYKSGGRVTGAGPAATPAPPALTNLHSDGKTTIGWDGKQWVTQATGQPYAPPPPTQPTQQQPAQGAQ